MLLEKDLEDIISKYPEIIEDGLTLKERQLTYFGRRMDLLFEDKFKRRLILELKNGPIKDQHIGQIMSYEGMLLTSDDPTVRIMLVGTRVPPNIQRTLDHHGIAWKELTYSHLKRFLLEKEDELFLNLFDDEEYGSGIEYTSGKKVVENLSKPIYRTPDDLIKTLKSSEYYRSFKTILKEKIDNEAKAKTILIENLGNLNHDHINEIIALVDRPYLYYTNGKTYNHPWFGRLLQANKAELLKVDHFRLNNWFNTISNSYFSVEKKIDLLLSESYKISGLNVGFITLILYVLEKETNPIWFEGVHKGLQLIYPEIGLFIPKSKQYLIFNEAAKKFAKQYAFDPTELDWIFSTGLPGMCEAPKIIKNRSINISVLRQLQMEFWSGLKTYMESKNSFVKMRTPYLKQWTDISIGTSDIYLAIGINSQAKLLNIWLVIRGKHAKANFDTLHKIAYHDSLSEISSDILWDKMESNKSCAVKLTQLADIKNRNGWEKQFEWLKEHIEKYVKFFKPRIKNLNTSKTEMFAQHADEIILH